MNTNMGLTQLGPVQLEEQAKAVQVQARGLTDSFVTKVAEAVPAQRAASIRLHLSVPALLLQRTSRMAVIKNDGTAVVEQEFNFQITAPTASLEMRVSCWDLCSTTVLVFHNVGSYVPWAPFPLVFLIHCNNSHCSGGQ